MRVVFVLGLVSGSALAQGPGRPVEPAAVKPVTLAVAPPSQNARWITRLYGDLLGRQPDAATLQAFQGELDRGAPRAQVATQVVSSTEYRSRVVQELYSTCLYRNAEPAAVSSWAGLIGRIGYLGVQKGILSSPEYFQKN